MEARKALTASRAAPIRACTTPAGRWSTAGLILTIAALGVYIAVRMQGLRRFSLWGGETFALDGVRMDWGSMMAYVIEDMVHPPLFYILFKLWIAIGGESLLWLKLFPALTATAALVPLVMMCRELRLTRFEVNLVLMLAAVNGYLIHYSEEVRMYSLFMFLAVCSGWAFVRYYNAGGPSRLQLLILSGTNVLLVHTHYFGWLLVGMELMMVLVWNRRKLAQMAASVSVLVVVFLPWVYFIAEAYARRGSTIGFIPRPTPYVVAYLYANLNGPLQLAGSILPGLFLFGAPTAWWTWRTLRGGTERGERMLFWWLAGCAFVPVALIAVASRVLRDAFWFDRYFIFMAPFYLVLVAAAVRRLRPAALRYGVAGSMVLWSAIAGYRDLATNRMAWTSPQLGSRFDWEAVARQFTDALPSDGGPVDVFALPVQSQGRLTGQWAIYTSIQFHLDSGTRERVDFHDVRDVRDLLRRPHGDDFWIAAFDLGAGAEASPLTQLANAGYMVKETLRSGKPTAALSISHLSRIDSSALTRLSGKAPTGDQ